MRAGVDVLVVGTDKLDELAEARLQELAHLAPTMRTLSARASRRRHAAPGAATLGKNELSFVGRLISSGSADRWPEA